MYATNYMKMTTALRRNTFTLTGSDLPIMSKSSVQKFSGMDRQNIMRLKVNRIAIVQELKVEHILDQLGNAGIISESEKKKIEKGTSPSDRARKLIDILPTKERNTDWYKHFRGALQNPDANVEFRRRYRDLVQFLDNTVIHRPESQAARFSDVDNKLKSLQYPKYEPLPAISEKGAPQNVLYLNRGANASSMAADSGETETEKTEFETEKVEFETEKEAHTTGQDDKRSGWSADSQDSMTLVKGYFHQWVPNPDNFQSSIEMPNELIKELTDSNLHEDKEFLEAEKRAFQNMRKLEVIAVLNRRKLLPQGFEICMCDTFLEILAGPEIYHLYLKYFRNIQMSGNSFIADIASSFSSILETLEVAKMTEPVKHALNTGFQIVDLFMEFNAWVEGGDVVMSLIKFLNTYPCIETWMAKYKAYVKLTKLRNKNYNFYGSQLAYFQSVELTWSIKMMSFGQDVIDESQAFVGLSTMLTETASFTPALGWANRALHEVFPDNTTQVIEALCNAVMACCGMWQVDKADMLAVQAVQMARASYGRYHPLHLTALLHWCHVCSEFFHTEMGVTVAKECLHIATRIYGCETLQTALAHRAVSRALMVMQCFDTEDFYQHAMESVRIARSQLSQEHPMLHIFLFTFASALQWKSMNCETDICDSTLRWAEAEAKQALNIVSSCYGEISLKTGQVYALLGQIYSKMSRLTEAEDHMVQSVGYIKLCQSPNSYYLLLAIATLGTFYKIINRPREAIPRLQQVIQGTESMGKYYRWVHMCYDNLVKLLQASGQNQEADSVHMELSQWLKETESPESCATLKTFDEQPPTLKKFLENFDKWGIRVKNALKGATELLKSSQ